MEKTHSLNPDYNKFSKMLIMIIKKFHLNISLYQNHIKMKTMNFKIIDKYRNNILLRFIPYLNLKFGETL